jgi:hypothetical protein
MVRNSGHGVFESQRGLAALELRDEEDFAAVADWLEVRGLMESAVDHDCGL